MKILLAVTASLLLAGLASAQTRTVVTGADGTYLGELTTRPQIVPPVLTPPLVVPILMERQGFGLDPSIPLLVRPAPPMVNPYAAMALLRATHEESILRQQQIAMNRLALGPCPPVLAPGEQWVPDVINPFSKHAAERRRQRADQRRRAAQAEIGCAR